jgi:hypothetical protein
MALCGAQIMSNMNAVLEAQRLAVGNLPLHVSRFSARAPIVPKHKNKNKRGGRV